MLLGEVGADIAPAEVIHRLDRADALLHAQLALVPRGR